MKTAVEPNHRFDRFSGNVCILGLSEAWFLIKKKKLKRGMEEHHRPTARRQFKEECKNQDI